ncbi:MAG: DUF6434 domain-containing protein [Ginsengibacter sp.]
MTTKPILNKNISLKDFQEFYWLKKELAYFCKSNSINATGGKIELSERIIYFLQHGEVPALAINTSKKNSKFDWNKEKLTLDTIITDNYKNTQNVRTFFIMELGSDFSFNVKFMNWFKENSGKKLSDAIKEWKGILEQKKDKDFQSEIAPQFEYNKYIRAFLADNPNKTLKDAMKFWKLKSEQRGRNDYERKDLELSM